MNSQSNALLWKDVLSAGLLLFLTVFAAFYPTLTYGFTNWDDPVHILRNPLVSGFNLSKIPEIFSSTVNGTYIPITILTYGLEAAIYGLYTAAIHFHNILLHWATATACYLLGRKLSLSPGAAVFGALIFALHPMHVESVAWATGRKDVLYAFFYVIALNFYADYLGTRSWKFLILSFLSGVLSLLSKPMAISLPLILLVMDHYFGRPITKEALKEKSGFFLAALVIGAVTYLLNVRVPAENWIQAPLIWCYSFVFYLAKFFWPVTLIPLYQLPEPVAWTNPVYLGGFALTLLTGVLLLKTKDRWAKFALLFYLASIFFLLRFDNTIDRNIVADRYMYLPSLGLCFYLGHVFVDKLYASSGGKRKKGVAAVLVFLVVIFTVKSNAQSRIWENSERLWTHVLAHSPREKGAYNNRGIYYTEKRQYFRALDDFDAALRIDSGNPRFLINRAVAYLKLNDRGKALSDLNAALALERDNVHALKLRAGLARSLGVLEKSIADYRRLVLLKPEDLDILNELALTLALDKEFADAEAVYRNVIRLHPRNYQALYNLGVLYLQQEKQAEAAAVLSQAIQVKPERPEAYFQRGLAYERSGQIQAAEADFQRGRILEQNREILE